MLDILSMLSPVRIPDVMGGCVTSRMHLAWILLRQTRALGEFLDARSVGKLASVSKDFRQFIYQVAYIRNYTEGLYKRMPLWLPNVKVFETPELFSDDVFDELYELVKRMPCLEKVNVDPMWGKRSVLTVSAILKELEYMNIKSLSIGIDISSENTVEEVAEVFQKLQLFEKRTDLDLTSVYELENVSMEVSEEVERGKKKMRLC